MDFLWEKEWRTQWHCKEHLPHHCPRGKIIPFLFTRRGTAEFTWVFHLPTIQMLQIFGEGPGGRKRESKAAKTLTPQLASPLAACLGEQGMSAQPSALTVPQRGRFPHALPLVTRKHLLSPLQSDGGGSSGTCISSHCTLGWDSLATSWKSLLRTGKKKKKSYQRRQGLDEARSSSVWPQSWPCCEQDVGPEISCLNYPVILWKSRGKAFC